VPLHMSVAYISFSAHADYSETSEFIELLKPPHVILVHGDASEGVGRLRYALESRYRDGSVRVQAPRNCQTLELQFRATKVAKVVSTLARVPPSDGLPLRGLLVRKNETELTLMAEEELAHFTALQCTSIAQSIQVPFNQTFECMKYFIEQMYELDEEEADQEGDQDHKEKSGDRTNATSEDSKKKKEESKEDAEMKDTESTASSSTTDKKPSKGGSKDSKSDLPFISVRGVRLEYHRSSPTHIVVRWQSNPVNDMLSDSLVGLLTNIQSNPGMAKTIGCQGGCRQAGIRGAANHAHDHTRHEDHHHHDNVNGDSAAATSSSGGFPSTEKPSSTTKVTGPSFRWFLEQHYGSNLVFDEARSTYSFQLDSIPVVVNSRTLEVECADAELRRRVGAVVRRAHAALNPINRINTVPLMEVDEKEEKEKARLAAGGTAVNPTSTSAAPATATPAALTSMMV